MLEVSKITLEKKSDKRKENEEEGGIFLVRRKKKFVNGEGGIIVSHDEKGEKIDKRNGVVTF